MERVVLVGCWLRLMETVPVLESTCLLDGPNLCHQTLYWRRTWRERERERGRERERERDRERKREK